VIFSHLNWSNLNHFKSFKLLALLAELI